MLQRLKAWAKALKHNIYALYLAYRSNEVSLTVKLLAAFTVAYALSPIDLIPDFIPILGYLDDVVLLPLLIALVIKLIPAEVWQKYRAKAEHEHGRRLPRSKTAAVVVVLAWVVGAVVLYRLFV